MSQVSSFPALDQFPRQPQLPAAEGLLDIQLLWRYLFRYKWGVLGLGLVFALVAIIYASSLTPIYQATSTLLIEKEDKQIVSIQELYTPRYYDWEYMQTQYELLRSRNLAERVVKKLGLHQDSAGKTLLRDQVEPEKDAFSLSSLKPAGFNAPPEIVDQPSEEELTQQRIAQATAIVITGLQVVPVQDTNLITLSFKSDDPKFAASVVNTLAEQYIESQLEARLNATRKATEWLNERLADLRVNLKKSEARLQSYREQQKLVDIQGVSTLGAQQLSELNARLAEARRSRLAAQTIGREVTRLQGAPSDEYLTIPAVLNQGLIPDLLKNRSAAERNVSELGKRYGVKHPRMINAQTELKAAIESLDSEVSKVVNAINREYQLAQSNEQALENQLESSKQELQSLNRKEFQIQELQREVDTNRQLYEMFFTRIQETNQGSGFEKAQARVVDTALVPTVPVSPNKKRIVVVASVMGLFLGCVIAVLLGLLDNTIKTPDDVQERLGSPMLGAIPKVASSSDGVNEQYWHNQNNSFAESIRTIRTGIVLSGLDNPSRIIVVTSSLPGEGKSTLALNLGSAFGHLEKTLVIGADLRKPSIAKKCQLPANHPGLSNYVAGSAELDECISAFGDEQMFVMPAGIIPSNPLEMLSSQKFAEALNHLKDRFDRIIIDSAPIQAVSDALILASQADSLLFVVKADSTSYTLVRKAINRLRDSNLPLTGVVLNQFDIAKSARYYGGKYDQYGEYYQSQET